MRIFKYLGNFCIILLAFTLTVSAKNRKAEGFWKDGRDAELRKEYDKALELYEKAQQTDPKDPAYQLAARRVRFQAAAAHVDAGLKLRTRASWKKLSPNFRRRTLPTHLTRSPNRRSARPAR